MIVGVISDSHDNIYALREVLQKLLEHGIEVLVHLGDIVSPFAVKLMKEVLGNKPVVAVRGNNDGDLIQLSQLFSKYSWTFLHDPSVVEFSGRRVLLIHGHGAAEDVKKLVYALARSLDVDAVFYGHTHTADLSNAEGKLVLNPGELCGYLTGRKSYALVDLSKMKAEVYYL